MLSQCPQCGLSKSSGAMGSVLPQCRCDWKMPTPQRTWVGLMRGVRVEGDTVVISVHYGNDAARQVCGALIEEMNT